MWIAPTLSTKLNEEDLSEKEVSFDHLDKPAFIDECDLWSIEIRIGIPVLLCETRSTHGKPATICSEFVRPKQFILLKS